MEEITKGSAKDINLNEKTEEGAKKDKSLTEGDKTEGKTESNDLKKTEKTKVAETFEFKGTTYTGHVKTIHSQGYVEEYYNGERCASYLLLPGMSLMPNGVMATIYFLFLMYLFLGISIIADIFMEAIEVVCSKTKSIEVSDKNGVSY